MSAHGDHASSVSGGGSLEPIWLGIGSPRPQARVLQNAMFGHVADAFDEKSIFKIGQQPPRERSAQDRQTTTTQAQAAGRDHTTAAATAAAADGLTTDQVHCMSSTNAGPSDGAQTSADNTTSNRLHETPLNVVSCS